jgi:hypothetical protein
MGRFRANERPAGNSGFPTGRQQAPLIRFPQLKIPTLDKLETTKGT